MSSAITSVEGWTEWVLEPTPTPLEPISAAQRDAMTPDERSDYDLARMIHNSREVVVETDTMRRLFSAIRRRHLLNQNSGPRARSGFVISGPPRTGKTTALQTFGRNFERKLRRAQPDRFKLDDFEDELVRYTPVVYFSLSQGVTEKTISKGLADWLKVSYRRGDNEQDVTRQVIEALRRIGTELLLIDEVHNLGRTADGTLGGRSAVTANDYLKNLCNHCAATPVFAGVNVAGGGLFGEFRGDRITQTAGRFTLVDMAPHEIDTAPGREGWRRLVMSMEEALILMDHPRGHLAKHEWRYLHARTGGYVATLGQLVREAALLAMDEGIERIDRDLLDRVAVDEQSRKAYDARQQATDQAVAKQAAKARRRKAG